MSQERVLVLAPHPDDAIIGCGGAMLNHLKENRRIAVCYMTSGENGSSEIQPDQLAPLREREAAAGLAALGPICCEFLRLPDGDVQASSANIQKIAALLRQERPHYYYFPHNLERHPDHRATAEIALAAILRAESPQCFGSPYAAWSPRFAFAYEVGTPMPVYNFIEDISTVESQKILALQEHKSQLNNLDYADAVRGLNRFRGVTSQKGKYCEVFQITHCNLKSF